MSLESASQPSLLDDDAVLLLRTIWDLLPESMDWPDYATVDRLLHRQHGLDIDPIIARIPSAFLRGGRPQGNADPLPEGQLALTAPGVAISGASRETIGILVVAARLAAQTESEPMPFGEKPAVEFEQIVRQLNLPSERRDLVACQSGLLLVNEPWSGSVELHEGGWKAFVDRRARRYAEVSTWKQYMSVRDSQTDAQPASVRPAASVVSLRRRWTVGVPIGSGGFGRVFHATGEDGTAAAIKFVSKEPGADREQLFVSLPGVRNVVPVIDHGEHDNQWVLVMPLASGTLADLIGRGAVPIDEAVEILHDLAAAVADLAALDPAVVHRDLKPANILRLGEAWCLADFGISRYAEAATDPFTHKLAMSVRYAAPERWNGERATAAVDVYAVGVIMHELLTGRSPFPGPETTDYRDQHLHQSAPRLPNDVPPRLAALIDACMAKPAGARPSPADLLARAERPFEAPRSAAAQALAAANRSHAEALAKQDAAHSQAQTDEQRRADLNTAAGQTLAQVSNQLLELVRDFAPAAQVTELPEGWSAQLGGARLGFSRCVLFDGTWGGWSNPPFDVIAYATVSIYLPDGGSHGYHGRSHSLYYSDPHIQSLYGWHETAFMVHPLIGGGGHRPQDPFALNPGDEAAQALWPGTNTYQVAWKFTRLNVGDLDDFNDRWIAWLAEASQGQLSRPHTVPEGDVGTWRRNE